MWKNGLIHHAVFAIGALWPAVLICRRTGFNPLWALTLLVPIFGLVCFTSVLAFRKWPQTQSATETSTQGATS
jgi:hypothetical protein